MNVEKILLREGEWIDDLQRDGLKIIQGKKGLRFGTDSVLLSDFASAHPGDLVVDAGTGTGVIAILLASRYPGVKVIAADKMAEIADMARRSVTLNRMEEQIEVLTSDIQNNAVLGHEFADAVVSNPPYLQKGRGLTSPDPLRAAARGGENSLTIEEWIAACSRLLKNGGRLYLSFPANDLARLMGAMTGCGIEPKRMRGVSGYSGMPAKRVLIEGKKQGNPGLEILPPLVTHNEDGSFTAEMKKIYGEPE